MKGQRHDFGTEHGSKKADQSVLTNTQICTEFWCLEWKFTTTIEAFKEVGGGDAKRENHALRSQPVNNYLAMSISQAPRFFSTTILSYCILLYVEDRPDAPMIIYASFISRGTPYYLSPYQQNKFN